MPEAPAATATVLVLALLTLLAACGDLPALDEEPETVPRGELLDRVHEAVAQAGGLSWTIDSPPSEPGGTVSGVLEVVDGEPDLRHVVVDGGSGGELIDLGGTICTQEMWTASTVPLAWPERPPGRPWNCLPAGDALWSMVDPRSGELLDPLGYLDELEPYRRWQRPELVTEDGEPRMRYVFDGHEVWLDSRSVPRRIVGTSYEGWTRTWRIAAAPDAEVSSPTGDQRTAFSPTFRQQVPMGGCCPPGYDPAPQ